jgi:hypothetical protein
MDNSIHYDTLFYKNRNDNLLLNEISIKKSDLLLNKISQIHLDFILKASKIPLFLLPPNKPRHLTKLLLETTSP